MFSTSNYGRKRQHNDHRKSEKSLCIPSIKKIQAGFAGFRESIRPTGRMIFPRSGDGVIFRFFWPQKRFRHRISE